MSILWMVHPQKSFKADSVKIVLSYAKQHTDAEAWSCASTNAQTLSKQWLKLRAKVDFLDVRPPTRFAGAPDVLQVIIFLPASSCVQVLRASGIDGVFNRPFIENDQDRSIYRVVPMPMDATLQVSIRKAQFIAGKAFGVVSYGAGFGIRVKSENFQQVLAQINPEKKDQFVGAKLEISDLRVAMGK